MIFSRIYNLITESSDAMKITLKYTTQKDTTSLQHQKDIAPTRLGLTGPTVGPPERHL